VDPTTLASHVPQDEQLQGHRHRVPASVVLQTSIRARAASVQGQLERAKRDPDRPLFRGDRDAAVLAQDRRHAAAQVLERVDLVEQRTRLAADAIATGALRGGLRLELRRLTLAWAFATCANAPCASLIEVWMSSGSVMREPSPADSCPDRVRRT
jgi:hypothetical protein